jgi:hypothetical protein
MICSKYSVLKYHLQSAKFQISLLSLDQKDPDSLKECKLLAVAIEELILRCEQLQRENCQDL